ncbi:MAG: septal ring lytic transglycosylase RlpA family protein [Alphaproteobacteria bacterium]|nr:septal ring lytic transglycosylase RlpA family protein [Alphaproteobacteria bacterium]MBQ3039594.1 septal ring lytic transglycosylase RlpA family protein [Alphaproteobacteria bacterium]MBQ7127477.1 septal ring lytic transglycosylase RlpA family protein [Alphaproteobacteria bacterium]
MKKIVSLAVLTALVSACADLSTTSQPAGYGADGFGEETLVAAPAAEQSLNTDAYLLAPAPKYYIGTAYKVEDVQYIPVEDMSYNQTGVAGIIPTELNGTKTSNGETFDAGQLLATSKTLPLPTIARVTNLDNGQSVVVRVNNRGPFVNTRIMDLSPAAAQKIGLNGQGKVQVQVMVNESNAVKAATLGANTPAQPAVVAAPVVTETVAVATAPVETPAPVATGDYSVQVAAFYAEDSATTLANRMKTYGDAVVVNEGDMYKVRIINLDATQARGVIDALRNNEGMAPGLLKSGRWVNADSI